MQVNCPNEGCNELYTVGPEHVGRRSVCKGCGATFVIEADGLRLVDAPVRTEVVTGTPATPETTTSPTRRTRQSPPSPIKDAFAPILADPFSLLMLAGTMVVIFFLFQPILDGQKISRIDVNISRLVDEGRENKDKIKENEDEIKELKEDKREATYDAREAGYVYTWFMLLGFLLLAVAEIGYLVTGAAKSKRVVGAILLSTQLLLVFMRYFVGSTISSALN